MPRYQRRVIMPAKRLAHPTMGDLAKGAAELVAPRTVEDGLSLANVIGDVGEWTPFAAAVPYIEDRLGIKDWDEETIAAMAALGLIPFAGKATRAVNRLVPNPKGGFTRNPMYDWNKLTPQQKAATTRAMEEWTSRAKKHTAAPQTPPVYNEFLDDNINDAVWNVAGDYKFTPKLNGKKNPDIKTQAMLPENTGEAAFLRHSPYVSNYDNILTTERINAEEERLARAGLLPRYTMEPYDDMGHFAKTFPTVAGSREGIGNSAKGAIIDELERKFPGYRGVMEGRGPGQSKYQKDHMYTSYMLTPTEEEIIQRKTDAILHDFPHDQLDELYKQHKNYYENEIERLQERLDYMKTEPEAEQKRLADLYKQLEHKQEFFIRARKALENAYNERILNDL